MDILSHHCIPLPERGTREKFASVLRKPRRGHSHKRVDDDAGRTDPTQTLKGRERDTDSFQLSDRFTALSTPSRRGARHIRSDRTRTSTSSFLSPACRDILLASADSSARIIPRDSYAHSEKLREGTPPSASALVPPASF